MEGFWQVIAHLLGDYVFQNHWMAVEKTKRWFPALLHGIFYTGCFALIFGLSYALIIIGVTHALIDRYRLTAYWTRFWGVGCSGWLPVKLGAPISEDAPPFLKIWLMILVDNIAHLIINAVSIHYLG